MVKNNDISEYEIVGTLSDTENCSVWIASKKDPTDSNLYLINRFLHSAENLWIFKAFFSYNSSENKSSSMIDFFAVNGSFYIIFKYYNAECISERYTKEETMETFDRRCSVLSSIILKIEGLNTLPIGALVTASNPDNLCIDNDDKIHVIYALDKINENATMADVYKNIAALIKLMLKRELSNKYDKHLPLVIEKCENNIYTSIPELIVDLEMAEKKCQDSNLKTTVLKFVNDNKAKIKKYSIIGGCAVCVLLAPYLIYTLFFTAKDEQVKEVSLGIINYMSGTSEEAKLDMIDTSSKKENTSQEVLDLYIYPDDNVQSQDYIVQYGDTLESICDSFYSSRNFVSTLQGFNSITSNAQLTAGLVIRIPDETDVRTLLSVY